MLKELDKQEFLKLYKTNPSNAYLLYSHNGHLYFVKHPSQPDNESETAISYKDVSSACDMLKKRFDLSSISDAESARKQFFSHSNKAFEYVKYTSIADEELELISTRYPRDYVFVYIESIGKLAKKTKTKNASK